MLFIVAQVLLLAVAVAMPFKSKNSRNKRMELRNNRVEFRRLYRIDTDTSHANYAINEFGTLEKISRLNWTDEKPEVEN